MIANVPIRLKFVKVRLRECKVSPGRTPPKAREPRGSSRVPGRSRRDRSSYSPWPESAAPHHAHLGSWRLADSIRDGASRSCACIQANTSLSPALPVGELRGDICALSWRVGLAWSHSTARSRVRLTAPPSHSRVDFSSLRRSCLESTELSLYACLHNHMQPTIARRQGAIRLSEHPLGWLATSGCPNARFERAAGDREKQRVG